MTDTFRVEHLEADRFVVDIRGHKLTVDQPVSAGGRDAGPTPTELFVAGLATCVAFYARRYLARHRIDDTGLAVEATFEAGDRPARVTRIEVVLTPPTALPADRLEAFLAVAAHCTVHNTLLDPPQVDILAAPPARAAVTPALTH